MGLSAAKLHEKPAKAKKLGTEREHKAGFFAPVNLAILAIRHSY
jgi:hypothetical protein